MEVGDGFAAVWSVVDDESEAVFGEAFLASNFAGFEEKVAEEFLVGGIGEGDAWDGFFGDEKKVGGGLG